MTSLFVYLGLCEDERERDELPTWAKRTESMLTAQLPLSDRRQIEAEN